MTIAQRIAATRAACARFRAGATLGVGVLTLAAAALRAQNSWPAMHPEPIAIRILDGRRGLPLAGVHVQIVAGYDDNDLLQGSWGAEAITDDRGRAMLPDALKDFGFLAIRVVKHKLCAAHGLSPRLSLGSIRNEGLSTPDECGTLVPARQPGVLIVFAKAHAKDLRPLREPNGTMPSFAAGNPLAAPGVRPPAASTGSPPPAPTAP